MARPPNSNGEAPQTKSNIGAEKRFPQNTPFSQLVQLKIKKYFDHKLIKNPSKIDISTIFRKHFSGSIRGTHPFLKFLLKKYKKTAFNQILLNFIIRNRKKQQNLKNFAPARRGGGGWGGSKRKVVYSSKIDF